MVKRLEALALILRSLKWSDELKHVSIDPQINDRIHILLSIKCVKMLHTYIYAYHLILLFISERSRTCRLVKLIN